jgi:aconitase A
MTQQTASNLLQVLIANLKADKTADMDAAMQAAVTDLDALMAAGVVITEDTAYDHAMRHLGISERAAAAGRTFQAQSRIDGPNEMNYLRNGGILPTVLRRLYKETAAA